MGSLMKPQALDMMAHALRRLILNFARWRKDSGIRREIIFGDRRWSGVDSLLLLLFRIVCGACVTQRAFASGRLSGSLGSALRRSFFDLLRFSFLPHNIGS